MKTFRQLTEARITLPKYVPGSEFTLNDRTPNSVHKALFSINYSPGAVFKKTNADHTEEVGEGSLSVTLEDEKKKIIKVFGSKSSLHNAFNAGSLKGGGAMKAADWEEVITIAHNRNIKGIDSDEAATLGEIKLPIKDRVLANINNGNGKSIIDAVNLPSKPMTHYGRGVGSPSSLWTETFKDLNIKMNSKSMTPKTDMYIGDMRISLKQTGGSQLMSGYAGDTAGVITAAYNKAIKNNKIDKAALKKSFDFMYKDVKDNFSSAQDVGTGSRAITKKAKSGATLNALERSVMETVQKGSQVQNHFRWIFSEHPDVKYYAIEEAMTGNMKFSDDKSISNYLMVFNPSGTGSHIDKIDKKIISGYVSKTTFSVGIKSAGSRGALSLRGIVQDEYEPTLTMKNIISEAWNEIGEDRIYLSEGLWKNIKDKTSSAYDWAKDKGLKTLKLLWDKIVNKIITLLHEGYGWIQRIFGWQPVVRLTSNPSYI
jgi:hypothetical protein